MNNWLLTLLIDSTRPLLGGRQVIACRYFKPVLSVALSAAGQDSCAGGRRDDRTGDRHEDRAGDHRIGWAGGPLYLTAVLSRSGSFVFLSAVDPLAGCPAERILSGMERCTIASIDQPRGDRIVRLELAARKDAGPKFAAREAAQKGAGPRGISAGGADGAPVPRAAGEHGRGDPRQDPRGQTSLSLLLTLYGRGGSAVLYDGDAAVDGVQRHGPGEGAARPAAQPFSTISEASLCSALRSNTGVPGLDARLRRSFAAISDEQAAAELISFRDSVASGARPFHLIVAGKPADAAPIPELLDCAGEAAVLGPFADSIAAAEALGRTIVAAECARRIDDELKPVRSFAAKKRTLLAKLQAEHEAAARHDDIRRKAETLAAYQSMIPPGASAIELPDPYGSGEEVTIALDPSRSVHAQIQKLFKRATKLKRSLRFLQMKIEHTQALILDLEKQLGMIAGEQNAEHALAAIDKLRAEYQVPVQTRGAVEKTAEKGYRRFDLGPMWFVLVGRSNHENDELTFHVAGPSDYWLHAQQVPGSHVILKSKGGKENPSETILETAAGIAAFFSKAKHSSIVPVICTLRKYVRKPRKGKPGQVLCSQMKTIFAAPGLPDERDE